MKKWWAAGHQVVVTATFDQNTAVGQDIIPLLWSVAPVIVSSASFSCFLCAWAISSLTPCLLVLVLQSIKNNIKGTEGVGGFSTLRLQLRVSPTHWCLFVSKKFFQDFHSRVKGIYVHGNPKRVHMQDILRPLFAKNTHIKSRTNCHQSYAILCCMCSRPEQGSSQTLRASQFSWERCECKWGIKKCRWTVFAMCTFTFRRH